MLLSMVVNKLGDPVSKVASKALHHLTEVAHHHPNMCGVLVAETEKLLFRNNVSERAQHFGLCFLASVTAQGASADVCSKLVNICFSLFNVLVQRGAVNSRTMQAILRCLQRAITGAATADTDGILSKEMQDTMYRLVHMAELPIAVQTFGLLLQLNTALTVSAPQKDRFYNALYRKLCDLQLATTGSRTVAQLLHILHRAMQADTQVARVLAFIKRVLQLTLYMPPHISAGCLIVLHKLLRSRQELTPAVNQSASTESPVIASKMYDAYHRVPAFAGAEQADRTELLPLVQHFHPTIQVLTDCIQNQKRLSYYGDPLQDFSLAHFLERFAFKNPKKTESSASYTPIVPPLHRSYVPVGARGRPVQTLTGNSCTEDEMFILNFMEQKRNNRKHLTDRSENAHTNEKDEQQEEEVENMLGDDINDDEFDNYLDSFFGGSGKEKNSAHNEQLEFMDALGGSIKKQKDQSMKRKQKTKGKNVETDADSDFDWDEEEMPSDGENNESYSSEDEQASINGSEKSNSDNSINDLDFDEDEEAASDDDLEIANDELSENEEEQDVDEYPRKRRNRTGLDDASFTKKLKSSDMSSLFAAADDFAEMLDDTATMRKQGTTNAVYAKGKMSEKQLNWEEKRHSNKRNYSRRQKKPVMIRNKTRKNKV